MPSHLVAPFLSALLAAAGGPARAEAPQPAEALLAKAKAAAGGDAWNRVRTIHARGRLRTSGLEGTVEAFDDLERGRFLDRFALGPLTGANGFDGKVVWSQDSSRQVREESGGEARLGAVDEAYRRRLAYWFPERGRALIEVRGPEREQGRGFQVFTITPEGGRPFDLWIDEATSLVDRFVEKTAMETRTTLLADYRAVDGLRVPFRIRVTNGEERYDQLTELDSVALDEPVDDSLFAMPAPPPPDFAFAGGKTSTAVPFSLVNNHIYLDVRLNGRGPFKLLCDTGGANIVTPAVARELGLHTEGALQGRGVGEQSEDVAVARVESVAVGDVAIRDQVFAVFSLEAFASVEGVPVTGIIGYEVFKRFVVGIDYQSSRLTLTLPSAFRHRGRGTAIPFQFNAHVPQVDGEIDGIPGKFDIDTGSRSSVDLLGPFAEKNGLGEKYRLSPPVVTGWGVGGPARSRVARARSLKLGEVVVREPVIGVSTQKKGSFTDPYVAGNVGGGVLKRFNVTFDYGRKVMYFERNANDRVRDAFDRSGMWINLEGTSFAVADVLAGGPAELAGIRAGERIVAVDGTPTTRMAIADLRGLLRTRAPGTRIRLLVEGGGQQRTVVLVLRELA